VVACEGRHSLAIAQEMIAEPTTERTMREAGQMQCPICNAFETVEYRPAEIERLDQVSFSYSFSPEHSKTFRVMRCKRCSHLFCSPLPERVTESYQEVVDEEYLRHADSRRLAAAAVVQTIAKHTVGRRLLDVGCATGDFLEAGRAAGFDVAGIELSSWSCAIARERGFTVHKQALSAFAEDSNERFDVISLIGVIEHFPDPRAEMTNIAKLLSPGGLVVVWTGDSSSWLARALGRHWWYWQGQHIQYFTERSLTSLVRLAGLEHLATHRYPFAATHATVSNSLRRYPMHRGMSAVAGVLFKMKPVIYLRLPGEMLLLARRPA
jgi:SAM-dependent methyltransferase